MITTQLDVVILGGGIQGLVALNALVAEGYSCALVSDGDLGSGQTIHSHGYLNTGFGMFGPELPRASADVVQPYLEQRGLELSHDWVLIPPPNMPAFEGLPPAALPTGFAAPLGLTAVRLPDRSVAKRRLVEVLSNGHRARILHGRATPRFSVRRVEAISVSVPGSREEVVLETKAIVVAAGCGSKRFLEGLVGQTTQSEQYVTPMEMGGPSFDDVPGDAAGEVDPEIVSRAWMSLLALFPRLPEVDGLQIGCYAGYRQDIGDRSGNRMCEVVKGTANVVVALPSGLIGAWLNATTLSEILGGLFEPSGAQPPLPGGGVGIRVDDPVEDRPDFKWMGLGEWSEKYSRRGVVGARQAPL